MKEIRVINEDDEIVEEMKQQVETYSKRLQRKKVRSMLDYRQSALQLEAISQWKAFKEEQRAKNFHDRKVKMMVFDQLKIEA